MRGAWRPGVVCLVVCILLSACGGAPERPEEVASVETRLHTRDMVDSRREFRDAVVGHELRGEGVDVTVGPDGTLIGTYFGQPFLGGWDYRRGLLCVSMREIEVRRAEDRKCFHAAIAGRTVLLVPAAED